MRRLCGPIARVVLVLAGLAPPAFGQIPDCTGISDVSDFDGAVVSDLDGSLDTVRIASGLTRPIFVASPPDDRSRLFIVEQDGAVRLMKNGALFPSPFLNLASLTRSPGNGGGTDQGLLGLAFHPGYTANGWFFVNYVDTTGDNNVIARYSRSATNPDRADPASGQIALTIPHPGSKNHMGGALAFSPVDGYLYVSVGDAGGSGCDPSGNAQSLSTNNGKILRIDVDTLPYSTAGNPFDGAVPGNDEIWSYGLRNPWRFSFDRITGAIYIADVGQAEFEEIDCSSATSAGGENYGWLSYEGSVCPNPSCCPAPNCPSCSIGPNLLPIHEYTHIDPAGSCSVTGGNVYRGCRMSDLHGHYFFADLCSNFIRSFRTDGTCAAPVPVDRAGDLDPGGGLDILTVVSFGEDAAGEIYVVDYSGEVFKILPALRIVELSALGATRLLLDPGADWSWEDLQTSSSQPISTYRVYRSGADPAGPFACVHEAATPIWPGGDPAAPSAGVSFFYLVTALDVAGNETRPGSRSDGTPRIVDTLSPCPP